MHVRPRLCVLASIVSFTAACSSPRSESTSTSSAIGVHVAATTGGGDNLRTGWYADQPGLSPQIVGGNTFGRMFSTAINGQVYAQPLVAEGTLFIATESNDIYGLDPESGTVRWNRNLGPAFDAKDVACGDLTPTIGVTGTPVIDAATHSAYFFSKTYTNGAAAWYAHAVDIASGAERPNFPVAITGHAANDPTKQFLPKVEMQRPGLLLMDGVVYAAFGAHCDHYTRPSELYRGWIAGVSTDGQLKTLYTTASGDVGFGSGIWQSGSGLVSDGPGQILFSTGNAFDYRVQKPLTRQTPPPNLTEAVVRVTVQPDGTLAPSDFFQPYDADSLDDVDADLGSGGPVALPPSFGSTAFPRLLVEVGKQGYVYLLNRDDLGGIATGDGGGDRVVSRVGPIGQGKNRGIWGRPAIWPGDGGYIYMIPSDVSMLAFKYGLDGAGKPSLSQVADSAQIYGYTSGSPVVTSDGTTSGSALVWVIGSGGGNGANGVLRAYDAVPVGGQLSLRFEQAIGTAPKFAVPGVGNGRIYVGTRDGHVIGFGSPIAAPISGPNTPFGTVILGQSAVKTIVLTAHSATSVSRLETTSDEFTIGAVAPTLPATLAAGDTLSVSVTFKPTTLGSHAANLGILTPSGNVQLALTGVGQSPDPVLDVSPRTISFGGVAVGQNSSTNIILANSGAAPLTINSITVPAAPFSATDLPSLGAVIPSGGSITAQLAFTPTAVGDFTGHLIIASTGGTVDLPLSGSAATPGKLEIAPLAIDYGAVELGESKSGTWQIRNTGGSSLTINKSKPPALGVFVATSTLDEGSLLAPGATLVETVVFTPTIAGTFSDGWVITASDGSGQHVIALTGQGIGSGLKGAYYSGASFDHLLSAHVDSTVNFDWAESLPDPSLAPGDRYSVRWSGQVIPAFSETYRFTLASCDGVRLFVDHQLLIDQWNDHDVQEDSGQITLVAKKAYDIKIEYYNANGGGHVALSWASASQPQQIVPTEALRAGAPAPVGGGWQLNGDAQLIGATLQLTPVKASAAGSAFWPGRLPSGALDISFDLAIDSGGGADGLTLTLADAAKVVPTALGASGGGLGFGGIAGVAIAFDTYKNEANPSANFVGISAGAGAKPDQLHWLTTSSNVLPLRGAPRHVDVQVRQGHVTVAVDGKSALEATVALPEELLIGFTGGSGGVTDRHAVSNVRIR
jgi:hypothetical protein